MYTRPPVVARGQSPVHSPRLARGKFFGGRASLGSSSKSFLVIFLFACACFALFLHTSPDSSSAPLGSAGLNRFQHPNFDFDTYGTTPVAILEEDDDTQPTTEEDVVTEDDSDEELTEEEESPAVEDSAEDDSQDPIAQRLHPLLRHSNNHVARPFLPYTCDACSLVPSNHPALPTCAKFHASGQSSTSPFDARLIERSVLYPGSGHEIRRILKRAMKSSLYGAQRVREGSETGESKYEDEEPFRILVLGGSVSNCRGVDEKMTCWHAQTLRWFQRILPLEGEHQTPLQSSRVEGLQRLDLPQRQRVKRDAIPETKKTIAVHRRAPKKATKPKKLRKKPKHRAQPVTRIINASKSATGSAFYAYCLEQELTTRRKNVDWGKGPDLVVIEVGINDVWPLTEVATRDFEKLLRTLRAMPSNPAVVVLEAASLLLAQTTPSTSNAEYLHLPAAQFYDVPVLSAKQALFGPTPALRNVPDVKIEDFFLPDLHHPNERGHELLADILSSYLEKEACQAQEEILRAADERIGSTKASTFNVDPVADFTLSKDEDVLPLPHRSLFEPFSATNLEPYTLPSPTCLQIGHDKSTVIPKKNSGWTKFAWARDKQYLVADKPGSKVTFNVDIGEGGTVLVDFLRSRFYNLGNVLVYLDSDRSRGVNIAGYWDLGWSIGVPTEIFREVEKGRHTVTFELLGSSQSSHPLKKTNFRLIGLITT